MADKKRTLNSRLIGPGGIAVDQQDKGKPDCGEEEGTGQFECGTLLAIMRAQQQERNANGNEYRRSKPLICKIGQDQNRRLLH